MTDTNEQNKVIPTGYPELDKLLDGGLRKDGCLITCTSNFGLATRFTLKIAGKFLRNVNYDKSVLYFLMGNSIFREDEIYSCLHIDSTKFNRFEIIDWQPNDCEMINVIKKYKCLSNLGLVIVDDIDHCKISGKSDKRSDFDTFLSMVTLKEITNKLNIPVLAVKQPMNPESFRSVSMFTNVILDIDYRKISATKITNTEFILKDDDI